MYKTLAFLIAAIVTVFAPGRLAAHCDGLDGPVVGAARQALETGDLQTALKWVKAETEPELKAAFARTLAVRKYNAESKDLADTYFFETMVRLHRAGEGAPYTGLKPAGRDLGPAIPAADKAIDAASPAALIDLLTREVSKGVGQRLGRVLHAREKADESIGAGREYVAAYVDFMHYVEGLHAAASRAGAHHEHAEE